jgi:3-methylfumaryl-CoA hydratase
MHLMVDAALKHSNGTFTGGTARLVHPLWVGDRIEVRGESQAGGKLKIWAANKNGVLCGEMELEFTS